MSRGPMLIKPSNQQHQSSACTAERLVTDSEASLGGSPGVLLRTGTMAGTVMAGPALEGGAACSNMRLTWNCSSFSRSAVLRMGPAKMRRGYQNVLA